MLRKQNDLHNIRKKRSMLIKQISLKRNVVRVAHITDHCEIQDALTQLQIPHPKTTIVLIGGAGGIRWLDQFPVRRAANIIARLAEETQSVVVDGGTQAGIMSEIGKQRQRHKFSFPLIGVVFDNLLAKEKATSILDPNHTNFILVPGKEWGDESSWISKIATAIAGNQKSITVLVNGGNISKTDVEYSLLENRPTVIMRGTGRLANEIALTENMLAVDISQNPDEILEILRARLS